jgi:hypothetical protein
MELTRPLVAVRMHGARSKPQPLGDRLRENDILFDRLVNGENIKYLK